MNILMSVVTLEQHNFLCSHVIYCPADTPQIVLCLLQRGLDRMTFGAPFHPRPFYDSMTLKLFNKLTESSMKSCPKVIYLALLHWHLLNLNTQFGFGYEVHLHMEIKHRQRVHSHMGIKHL